MKVEFVYLLISSMPQRVFVGLRNFKAKIMEGKRNMFNVQYLFQG